MQIRPLRSDEVSLFRELRLQALADAPTAFRETYEEALAKPQEDWAQAVRDLTQNAAQIQLLAAEAGDVVGMIAGLSDRQNPNTTWVASLWVQPDHRGKGIASALLHHLLQWAADQQKPLLRLRVTENNEAAIALYHRAGFQEDGGRLRLPWHPSLHVISMSLDLTAG